MQKTLELSFPKQSVTVPSLSEHPFVTVVAAANEGVVANESAVIAENAASLTDEESQSQPSSAVNSPSHAKSKHNNNSNITPSSIDSSAIFDSSSTLNSEASSAVSSVASSPATTLTTISRGNFIGMETSILERRALFKTNFENLLTILDDPLSLPKDISQDNMESCYTLLIVDDDGIQHIRLKLLVEKWFRARQVQCKVYSVCSGEFAVNLFARGFICDAVFMDYNLGLDNKFFNCGLVVAKKLRNAYMLNATGSGYLERQVAKRYFSQKPPSTTLISDVFNIVLEYLSLLNLPDYLPDQSPNCSLSSTQTTVDSTPTIADSNIENTKPRKPIMFSLAARCASVSLLAGPAPGPSSTDKIPRLPHFPIIGFSDYYSEINQRRRDFMASYNPDPTSYNPDPISYQSNANEIAGAGSQSSEPTLADIIVPGEYEKNDLNQVNMYFSAKQFVPKELYGMLGSVFKMK